VWRLLLFLLILVGVVVYIGLGGVGVATGVYGGIAAGAVCVAGVGAGMYRVARFYWCYCCMNCRSSCGCVQCRHVM